jgi:phosphonate transport system substrate-binding protein
MLLKQVLPLFVGAAIPRGLLACGAPKVTEPTTQIGKLTIGIVTYGEGARSVDQYQGFVTYLEDRVKALVELEPAYSEVKAVEQIQRQNWSLVFAPPGLAAIAISKAGYLPIFPMEGSTNLTAVFVMLKDAPIQGITDVNSKIVALGQSGSATGYYLPLYELYGTTPAEVKIASTPKMVMEWIVNQTVALGAMAKPEFEQLKSAFSPAEFRTLPIRHRIPTGAVLLSPGVDTQHQQQIQQALNEALPSLAQTVGYIPNAEPPDYKNLIVFINKVKPIEARLQQKPAPLYADKRDR